MTESGNRYAVKENYLKNKRRLVTILINLLFIAAIAVVGWKIYDYLNDSRQTTELAEELWEEAAITAAPTRKAVAAAPDLPVNETEKTGGETPGNEAMKPEESSEEMPAPKHKESASGEENSVFLNLLNTTATPEPTPRYTDAPDIPVGINFEKLAKTNRDVRAWLYHPGMGINLPVVQAGDNEYYLRRGFNRFTRRAGTLVVDYRNKGDFSDRNTIIYGHARTDLTMFGKLHYYKKAEYCEQHPFFYLYVPGHRYRLEIVTTGYTKDASMYYDLPAGDYWDELVEKLMERSPYDFGIPLSPDDHYVTLSTCAYDYQDERWLVIARIDDPDGTLPAFRNNKEP